MPVTVCLFSNLSLLNSQEHQISRKWKQEALSVVNCPPLKKKCKKTHLEQWHPLQTPGQRAWNIGLVTEQEGGEEWAWNRRQWWIVWETDIVTWEIVPAYFLRDLPVSLVFAVQGLTTFSELLCWSVIVKILPKTWIKGFIPHSNYPENFPVYERMHFLEIPGCDLRTSKQSAAQLLPRENVKKTVFWKAEWIRKGYM